MIALQGIVTLLVIILLLGFFLDNHADTAVFLTAVLALAQAALIIASLVMWVL